MTRLINSTILIICALLISITSNAQNEDIKQLEKERIEALKEIEKTSIQLNKNKKDVNNTLERIKLMSKEISIRKSIISDLDKEINKLDREELYLTREINYLQQKLDKRKKDYAIALQHMWRKKGDINQMLFIFSAQNITQAMRRARYMKEYAIYQRIKGEEISHKQTELNEKKNLLNKKKLQKKNALVKVEGERKNLEIKEIDQKKVMKDLQSKSKHLQKQLADQKTRATKLANRIKSIIEEEARKAAEQARKEAAEQAKKSGSNNTTKKSNNSATSKSKKFIMDNAAQELAGEFSANKGKLPAPISAPFMITAYYGEQQHPDLPRVKIDNHGIELQAEGQANARAVYEGVVSRVFAVPGSNTSVMVRHGNYFTIYSNLSSVSVKQGDKVSMRQALGKIYIENGRSILQFQLWKETSRLNPLPWIAQ